MKTIADIISLSPQGPPILRYTGEDSERAHKEWKATCGPHSIAAACGFSLEEVRLVLTGYKGWMNPTMVGEALKALDFTYALRSGLKTQDLCEGINRIQWEGEWLNPGVPARVAYYYTHYVAHRAGWVLCTAVFPAIWIPSALWAQVHRDEGSPFHITHHYILNYGSADEVRVPIEQHPDFPMFAEELAGS